MNGGLYYKLGIEMIDRERRKYTQYMNKERTIAQLKGCNKWYGKIRGILRRQALKDPIVPERIKEEIRKTWKPLPSQRKTR
jgi:hypothetical protein